MNDLIELLGKKLKFYTVSDPKWYAFCYKEGKVTEHFGGPGWDNVQPQDNQTEPTES